MWVKRVLFVVLCIHISLGHTTQRPSRDDEGSPLLDLASTFIQQALNNQNDDRGSGPGLAGVASLIGSFMQNGNGNGKSNGAAQILSGIGTLLANSGGNSGGGGGGFDPSIIGNVIEMFTSNSDSEDSPPARGAADTRRSNNQGSGVNWDAILQVATVFMDMQQAASPPQQKQKRSTNEQQQDNGLLSLLPMVMQAVSSFTGPEGQRTQEKHKNHAWALPPFLEQVHVLWDHFSNSDLADALYKKSGAHAIFQVIIRN